MARERKNYQVRDSLGNVVATPAFTVYNSGTPVLANLYSDDVGVGTPMANPNVGDANGRFYFYASDGRYDIVITGTGIVTYTLGVENFVYQGIAVGTGITSINTLTDAAQVMVPGTAGTDFAIVSGVGIHTFNLPTIGVAGVTRGLLTSVDYAAFTLRILSLNGQTQAYQTFALGTTGTDVNWLSAVGIHTLNVPTIGLAGATRGLLSTADYVTLMAKQAALPAGTNLQYVRGDLVMTTLNSAIVPELTNLYYTDARARAAISGTAPVTYVAGTGVISMAVATAAVNGYLAAADFVLFTAKIGSLNGSTQPIQTFVAGAAGTDFAISTVAGTGVHTFNIPSASAANRGLVTIAAQTLAGVKTLSDTLITQAGRIKRLRIATTTPVTVAVTDHVVVTRLAAAGAVAVNLPAGVAGQEFVIKDGTGDATANNVTITPAAGNIDGAGTYVLDTNYQATTLIYDGTVWNVIPREV